MNRLNAGLTLLFVCFLTGSGTTDGPPYDPQEALSTFEIADGFRIELYAAEPLVMDPIAMTVDASGLVYVVEMPGYPLDTSGVGRVVTLRDTDGDGLPDTRTVFADGFTFINGVMPWKDGVIVTDAPDVLYLADTDGDGRADVREVLLTGFAPFHPQHNVNHPTYGLDNGIYLANLSTWSLVVYDGLLGGQGDVIRFPGHPDAPTLPPNADGRVVRFHPDHRTLEAQSGESQFGLTFDAWGHPFFTHNTIHVSHEGIAARYLDRNPHLLVSDATARIAAYGYPAEVFPITENPQHQLLTDVGVITSACGLTYYLGGLFPERLGDLAFVAEPTHNLVHAMRIEDDGSSFTATRLYDGKEFLASRDSWFRPVNFYTGPDGALYLVDFYRQVIDHPEWLSEDVVASGVLDNGTDRGRIYRIVPEDHTAGPDWTNNLALDEASDAELVRALESPNAWMRRTAQRLLVGRNSPASAGLLTALARNSASPTGRLHALWTLDGLGRLEASLVAQALRDPSAGVRENAIRLAERHLTDWPELEDRLLALADDPDPKVRFQLLNTLGFLTSPEAAAVREKLLFQDIEDEWVQVGALSATSVDVQALYAEAVRRLSDHETSGRRVFFQRLGSLAGAGYADGSVLLPDLLQANLAEDPAWWQAAALEGAVEGLRRNPSASEALASERSALLDTFFSGAPSARDRILDLLDVLGLPEGDARARALQQAEQIAADRQEDPLLRADAIRLLALAGPSGYTALIQRIIRPEEPSPVQQAGIRALGSQPGSEAAAFLLRHWDGLHPEAVDAALSVITREPERVRLLLDALEEGRINPAAISWDRRVGLMMSEDPALRERARQLLSGENDRRDLVLARYRSALEGAGDAERGRAVFLRACATCHRSGDLGTPFGPDLGTIRSRDPESILTDILIPNRYIADGYALQTIETADGATLQGIITAETPAAVTLTMAGGRAITRARDEIRSMTASEFSAMPAGLEQQISPAEMADLLAFLKASR